MLFGKLHLIQTGATLRWELSKDDYAALPAGNLACIAPENILLLNG